MEFIYKRPDSLKNVHMHYCPGCTHGTIHKIITQLIDKFDVKGICIGISSVGCTYNSYDYFDVDMIQAAHGRAPAVATAVKRVHPDSFVFTYQGDGDLAAIGTAEIVHAALRGENITTIFVNNAVYGMTSGQMAPTTLLNQVTQTTPYGRDKLKHGYPIKVCEMISTLDGAAFVERTSMHDIKNIKNTMNTIEKAFKVQLMKKGFSLVEVLSNCPTNWGMSPVDSLKWIEKNMVEVFPLGNFKGNELEGLI